MTKPHIHVSNLGKRFNREWIFHNLTFTFKPGNIYAITGPNGSGKSTLMNILWGQMPPSAGSVTYFLGDEKLLDEDIYQQVAVAAPYMDLVEEFTLIEQLEFHFKMKFIRKNYSIENVIESLYLSDSKDKPIANFSSGMKQRLKLGLAFYTETPVLFLDEPGTNLDRQALSWYHEKLNEVVDEKLIVIASNQPEEYPKNAVEVNISEFKQVFLNNGKSSVTT